MPEEVEQQSLADVQLCKMSQFKSKKMLSVKKDRKVDKKVYIKKKHKLRHLYKNGVNISQKI